MLLYGIRQSSLAAASSKMCPVTTVLVVEADVGGSLMYFVTGVNVMCQSVLPLPALGRASVSGSGDHGDKPYGGLAVLLPSARVGTFYGPQEVLPVTREALDRERLFD